MSYKIAGIDVHKKVLMVVVMSSLSPADRTPVSLLIKKYFVL